jgi:hypothetical protein
MKPIYEIISSGSYCGPVKEAERLAREVYQLRKENEELQKRIDVLEATDNTWTHLTERGEIHMTTDRE